VLADPSPTIKVRSPRVVATEALDKAVAAAQEAAAAAAFSSSSGGSGSASGRASNGGGGTSRSSGLMAVGAEVELASGFAAVGDAADGPLKEGDVGEVGVIPRRLLVLLKFDVSTGSATASMRDASACATEIAIWKNAAH
jgi:hypothetical protein